MTLTAGKPTNRSEKFVFRWKQATWYFSKKNLDAFTNDPEKFASQYGGFRVYACSIGHKAPTDQLRVIIDGKLYLNKSLEVQEKWNKNQKERIEQADNNWPLIRNKE